MGADPEGRQRESQKGNGESGVQRELDVTTRTVSTETVELRAPPLGFPGSAKRTGLDSGSVLVGLKLCGQLCVTSLDSFFVLNSSQYCYHSSVENVCEPSTDLFIRK